MAADRHETRMTDQTGVDRTDKPQKPADLDIDRLRQSVARDASITPPATGTPTQWTTMRTGRSTASATFAIDESLERSATQMRIALSCAASARSSASRRPTASTSSPRRISLRTMTWPMAPAPPETTASSL